MVGLTLDERALKQDIDKTNSQLDKVADKVGRKALRKAAGVAGGVVLRDAKRKAPQAKTGLFSKSLMKKPFTKAADGIYMSIVGQRLRRAGGSDKGDSKSHGFSVKQVSQAQGHGMSSGISGTGKAVPMHFTMRPVKAHDIHAKNAKKLAWDRAKGNRPIGIRTAISVRHPGRRTPKQWLTIVKNRNQRRVNAVFFHTVQSELATIIGGP